MRRHFYGDFIVRGQCNLNCRKRGLNRRMGNLGTATPLIKLINFVVSANDMR